MRLKKFTAGLMCTLMAASMAGCTNTEEPANTTKAAETTKAADANNTETTKATDAPKSNVDIKYWVAMNGNVLPVAQNYGEIQYYKELEKKTGVHIEFQHPPVGQEVEQFKLLIASRKDLPDVVQAIWLSEYPGGPEKAIKDGVIIPLNDYMAKAPNYQKKMDESVDFSKQNKTDEGTIFAFQGFNEADTKAFSGLMLRGDWLKELNLEPPTTIDEWTTVLTAFKEKKGAQSPLSTLVKNFTNQNLNLFNAAYDVGIDFYLDDAGKVQWGPIQPGYKEYMSTLNKWYEAGLLDQDFASIDNKIVEANILNDKAGATFGWVGGDIGKYYKGATQEGFELVAVANPVLNKGDEGNFLSGFTNKIAGQAAAITTSAKNVDSIISMFDYLYTDEGRMLKNFGIEGETYNMVDGKPVYTDLILKNPDNLAIANALAKYVQSNYGAPGICEVEDYQVQYYQLDAQKNARKTYNQYVDNAAKHVIPPVSATPDESKELATITTEVSTYRDEQFVAFVTGVRPIEEFDKFVEEIKSLNIDRAIEIKEAGITRYNNR